MRVPEEPVPEVGMFYFFLVGLVNEGHAAGWSLHVASVMEKACGPRVLAPY